MQRFLCIVSYFFYALIVAVAVVVAFPDEVIQPLVLWVPEGGSKMEPHLAEERSEVAEAVLYVLVSGNKVPYRRLY